MGRTRIVGLAAVAVAALALTGCDNGPSAVAHNQAAGTQLADNVASDTAGSSRASDGQRQADHRRDPVRSVGGKPMWSASRKFSADENAERAFERNGKDFGAANLDEFVRKAHAFVDHPPKGALTLVRRNGDTLIYDPKANVFAVASKDGAPRTMFKPDDGMAYWEQQKAREAKGQANGRKARSDNEA